MVDVCDGYLAAEASGTELSSNIIGAPAPMTLKLTSHYSKSWQSLRLQTVRQRACLRHCPSEGQCLRAGYGNALGRLSPKVTFCFGGAGGALGAA